MKLSTIYWARNGLRAGFSATLLWLSAAVITSLMPSPKDDPNLVPRSALDVFRVFEPVLPSIALPVLCCAVFIVVVIVTNARDMRRRDPIRRFSRQQRSLGMARAGGQCEMENGVYRRCSREAQHGDHFYPWSKGGATSLQNFVAACSVCNRRKAAKIPSPGQQKRMERRRLEYVTAGADVSVGERRALP